MVALSQWEVAQVVSAAGRAGLAAGAWLGEVGVRAAARAARDGTPGAVEVDGAVLHALMADRAELMDLRRLLRNATGNLNQIAARLHSTGELAASIEAVLELVARTVARVDAAVTTHAQLLDATRDAVLEARDGRDGRDVRR